MARESLPVISLFSGALGLDLGLEAAGFRVRVAVESNHFAADTIRRNRPDITLIQKPIERVPTKEILEAAGLEPGEPALVSGGPSCQAFSTVGHRHSLRDPRGVMFREFLRVVREARPRFFVMENVRGMLSAAIRHRPLRERGPGFPPLRPEERLGSALKLVLDELRQLNYFVVFDLLNAADYGVPQRRERLVFLGSRDGEPLQFAAPTHASERNNGSPSWVTLRQAMKGLKEPVPQYGRLSRSQERFMKHVPAGGNWKNLPRRLQEKAMGRAYRSWGGRVGFYRRLHWDRPAPALTTRPNSRATMFCHPDELRPLTVREYARIQQFPDDWCFAGGTPQQYLQIGNAVPIGLGHAIGAAIRAAMRRRGPRERLGVAECRNDSLLDRLAKRPATILNPRRMRTIKKEAAAREWLLGSRHSRLDILGLSREGRRGQKRQDAQTPERRRGRRPSP